MQEQIRLKNKEVEITHLYKTRKHNENDKHHENITKANINTPYLNRINNENKLENTHQKIAVNDENKSISTNDNTNLL